MAHPLLKLAAQGVETLLLPITTSAALIIRKIKRVGYWRLPVTKKMLERVGVNPILDHYYEPMVTQAQLRKPLSAPRALPGIDMNEAEQLRVLSEFDFASELDALPVNDPKHPGKYFYNNIFFFAGDAEYYYSIIRARKPKRIVEIGSGFSTLMAMEAVKRNKQLDASYHCTVTCIEPYHNEWLESTGATIIRSKVEEVDRKLFTDLEANDILFIDSSHVVKPQGDVLLECFELLPSLAHGVLIHIHDIFTPKDYPATWVFNDRRLWHEQYLVEALLMYNSRFRIIGALNHLYSNHRGELEEKFPKLRQMPPKTHEKEPASLWLRVDRQD
jgi:hypothetical protein